MVYYWAEPRAPTPTMGRGLFCGPFQGRTKNGLWSPFGAPPREPFAGESPSSMGGLVVYENEVGDLASIAPPEKGRVPSGG